MSDKAPEQPPEYSVAPLPNEQCQSIGTAVASLVCGILSYFCCGLLSIPAIVTGHMALGRLRRGEMPENGRGYAMAGLVLGYLNLALFALILIAAAIGMIVTIIGSGAGTASPFLYAK